MTFGALFEKIDFWLPISGGRLFELFYVISG